MGSPFARIAQGQVVRSKNFQEPRVLREYSLMILFRCVMSVALLGVVGCGGDGESSVTLVPVKGTISLNGKPMENAAIAFVPDPSNKDQTPGGDTTGPMGNYMARFRSRSGLAPGKYKVTVTPGVASSAGSGVGSDAFKDDPFMGAEATRAGSGSKPAVKKLEIKAEFEAVVEPGGSVVDKDVKATAAATASIAEKK